MKKIKLSNSTMYASWCSNIVNAIYVNTKYFESEISLTLSILYRPVTDHGPVHTKLNLIQINMIQINLTQYTGNLMRSHKPWGWGLTQSRLKLKHRNKKTIRHVTNYDIIFNPHLRSQYNFIWINLI